MDGGQNWTLVNSPGNSQIERLENTEMAFANPDVGWMLKDSLGGFEPFIEITRDGGVSLAPMVPCARWGCFGDRWYPSILPGLGGMCKNTGEKLW